MKTWDLKLGVTGLAVVVSILFTSVDSAHAASSTNEPFTFAQVCDTQLGMGGYDHDVETFTKAVARINALNPDFVVICGDLVHDRDAKSFTDFKRIKAAFTMPCYCVPGNHDVGNEPTPATLRYYRDEIGPDYESFEHKGRVFVLVNTQLWKAPLEAETEKQDAWLRKTLAAAAEKKCMVFVVGHYPLFLEDAAEEDEYMNLPLAKRMELLDLYERSGVVAVLGGHAHRLIINEHAGMRLVNGETTSKNFDQRPMGFRLWRVAKNGSFSHEFIPVEVDGIAPPSTSTDVQ